MKQVTVDLVGQQRDVASEFLATLLKCALKVEKRAKEGSLCGTRHDRPCWSSGFGTQSSNALLRSLYAFKLKVKKRTSQGSFC